MTEAGTQTRIYFLVALQAVLVTILLTVPFGLDQDSSWGSNYGHFFLIMAIYIILLLAGLIETVVERKWPYVMIQIGLSALAFLAYLK